MKVFKNIVKYGLVLFILLIIINTISDIHWTLKDVRDSLDYQIQQLSRLETNLRQINTNFDEMNSDIKDIKSDVSWIESDVDDIQSDVEHIKRFK
jgi:predicted nuclease with TOPRIM domain